MIFVVEGADRAVGDTLLGPMFEARKRVFVDLLGWDVPVLHGRFEVDEFDDPHAVYILVTDQQGCHLGSARLLPTLRPHILGNLFPSLCASAPPAAHDIMEITRFCLDPAQPAQQRRQTRNRLVSAIVDYALEQRLIAYTGVAEIAWLQQILAFGWHCRPLGLPRLVGETMLGALCIAISAETPALLERNGIYEPSELRQAAVFEAA